MVLLLFLLPCCRSSTVVTCFSLECRPASIVSSSCRAGKSPQCRPQVRPWCTKVVRDASKSFSSARSVNSKVKLLEYQPLRLWFHDLLSVALLRGHVWETGECLWEPNVPVNGKESPVLQRHWAKHKLLTMTWLRWQSLRNSLTCGLSTGVTATCGFVFAKKQSERKFQAEEQWRRRQEEGGDSLNRFDQQHKFDCFCVKN